MRIDKWLWVARFFKTRSRAKDAVVGGKVHINGERCKAARNVEVGDTLEISRGVSREIVLVKGLAEHRGNATKAQTLYEETEASLERRLEESAVRRMTRAGLSAPKLKPSKSDRKSLRKIRQKP